MEDTIIALLNNNLRVIIPDFGAFIIRQKQPRIIVFNEFLRYNDGILIDFIVKNEGIDREIAEQRVADFADDGTKLLASGREMIIAGLGTLQKDSSGKISFSEAPEITEINNTEPEEPEILLDAEEKQEIPKVVEMEIKKKPKSRISARTKKTTKGPVKKTKRSTKSPAKKIHSEVPFEVMQPPAVVVELPEETVSETAEVPVEIKTTETEYSIVTEPAKMEPPPKTEPDAGAARRVIISTNRILAWALVILFLNAAILALFIYRKKARLKSESKTTVTMISDTLYDQLADSVRAAAMDTGIVFSEAAEPVNSKDKTLSPDSRYYIVAGCFRDEINADSLVTSLKQIGYKAEKFGKIGNLYAVCFASFDNKEDAVPELKKIRKKFLLHG